MSADDERDDLNGNSLPVRARTLAQEGARRKEANGLQGGAEPQRRPALLRELTVGGIRRSYRLYLPSAHDKTSASGVILAFHGGGGHAAAFSQVTSLTRAGGERGFVLVYPEGYRGSWNTGGRWGQAFAEQIDDVAFVRAILRDLGTLFAVDPSRVFAAGFSNGGSFAYRLACELSEGIAAIAVVAAALNFRDKQPLRPVPLLHFHGTADLLSPFSGGHGQGPARDIFNEGVPRTVARWLAYNGLSGIPSAVDAGEHATFISFTSDAVSSDVILCIVPEMGHQWPGGALIRGFGATAGELYASDVIVDFFLAHPLASAFRRIRRPHPDHRGGDTHE